MLVLNQDSLHRDGETFWGLLRLACFSGLPSMRLSANGSMYRYMPMHMRMRKCIYSRQLTPLKTAVLAPNVYHYNRSFYLKLNENLNM